MLSFRNSLIDTEENSDLLSIECPHCYRIPRVLIITKKNPKVLLKCRCGLDKSITIEKYLQFLKEKCIKK